MTTLVRLDKSKFPSSTELIIQIIKIFKQLSKSLILLPFLRVKLQGLHEKVNKIGVNVALQRVNLGNNRQRPSPIKYLTEELAIKF